MFCAHASDVLCFCFFYSLFFFCFILSGKCLGCRDSFSNKILCFRLHKIIKFAYVIIKEANTKLLLLFQLDSASDSLKNLYDAHLMAHFATNNHCNKKMFPSSGETLINLACLSLPSFLATLYRVFCALFLFRSVTRYGDGFEAIMVQESVRFLKVENAEWNKAHVIKMLMHLLRCMTSECHWKIFPHNAADYHHSHHSSTTQIPRKFLSTLQILQVPFATFSSRSTHFKLLPQRIFLFAAPFPLKILAN